MLLGCLEKLVAMTLNLGLAEIFFWKKVALVPFVHQKTSKFPLASDRKGESVKVSIVFNRIISTKKDKIMEAGR